ncbi:MAG: hypothetical protein QW404_03185 [Candidatus Nanoarchaeia archaeon]
MRFAKLRAANISETKEKLSNLSEDFLIIKVVKSVDEVSRVVRVLKLRLDDWSLFYNKDAHLSAFAREVKSLEALNKKLDSYLLSLTKKRCPHLTSVASHLIAARLIAAAGSLEKLAMMPSSKIQVLGAEKALFRHLKTGSKPPKYGIIFSHDSVVNSSNKGKAARHLASKIAIAARQDFFG